MGCTGSAIPGVRGPARRVCRPPSSPPRLQERPPLEFLERLPELLLRVHHDRDVPRGRLLKRLPRKQKEPDPLVSGLPREALVSIPGIIL